MAARPRHPRIAPKNLVEHVATQTQFLDTELKPKFDAAQGGGGKAMFSSSMRLIS